MNSQLLDYRKKQNEKFNKIKLKKNNGSINNKKIKYSVKGKNYLKEKESSEESEYCSEESEYCSEESEYCSEESEYCSEESEYCSEESEYCSEESEYSKNDIRILKNNQICKNNSKKIIKKKKNIPSTIKRLVWNKYIGEDIGKFECYCCKLTKITQMSFHCGHVISEKNNGEITVDNLRPICQNCNSSMGTTDMDKFISKYKLHT